jgi:arylformamidase
MHVILDWDDAYSNSRHIAGAEGYAPKWAARAAAFRDEMTARRRARVDLAYGSGERQKLDLFLPGGAPKGLFVFVHGGYWMAFDKSYWSDLARGPVERGWAAALPSYALAPAARISDITRETAAAIDFGPLRLAGHSAGGHIVTRMISHSSPLGAAAAARVEAVVSISGLHDLRPLMRTQMNEKLRLDLAEAEAESAALLRPAPQARVTCWVGERERPEFLRQNDLLANIWTGLGAETRAVHAPGRHHFDVIDALGDPSSELAALCAP